MKAVTANISNNLNNNEVALVKNVIFAGNGIFEKMNSWLGTAIKRVDEYELGKEFPDMEESVEIYNKKFDEIPRKALLSVVKWYRYVTEKTGDEAQINFYRLKGRSKIFYIEDKKYNLDDIDGIDFWSEDIFSYVPLQHNSGALTEVAKEDEFYNRLNEVYGLYVETHSHNSMNAFRSGTDEKYSYNDGLQLVFGKLNTKNIEMYSWACVRGLQKAGLSKEELGCFFDVSDLVYNDTVKKIIFNSEEITDTDEDIELFEKWNKQVIKKPEIKYPSYNFGKYYDYGKYKDYDYDKYQDYSIFDYVEQEDIYGNYKSKEEKLEEIRDNFLQLIPESLMGVAEIIADAYIKGLDSGTSYISNVDNKVDELLELLDSYSFE